MKIARNAVVSFDYTLKNNEGEILDTSDGEEPLWYLHGHGQIVPGLEKSLEGRGVGDTFAVVVPPEEAYGEVMEGESVVMPRDQFPEEGLELGIPVDMETEDGGELTLWVVDADDEQVVLDVNHPLAGETLNFSVTIRSVREADPEELEHGHAHPPEGGLH